MHELDALREPQEAGGAPLLEAGGAPLLEASGDAQRHEMGASP